MTYLYPFPSCLLDPVANQADKWEETVIGSNDPKRRAQVRSLLDEPKHQSGMAIFFPEAVICTYPLFPIISLQMKARGGKKRFYAAFTGRYRNVLLATPHNVA